MTDTLPQDVPLPISHASPVSDEQIEATQELEEVVVGKSGELQEQATDDRYVPTEEELQERLASAVSSEGQVEDLVPEGALSPADDGTAAVPAILVQAEDSGPTEDAGDVAGGQAVSVSDEAVEDAHGESVEGGENEDGRDSPFLSAEAIRPGTPSSRTSTPPLTSGSSGGPALKKFSSVNVNRRFLSKASPSAPVPTGSPGTTGLNAASPVPISSASSRLLSTKLTTIPSSKSSTSPQPSTPGANSASGSPWAKPALPLPPSSGPPIKQIPKARTLSSNVSIGSGQGIGGSIPRKAWKTINAERRAGLAIARDFPTASEIAEGKKAAQLVAQAHAAHNQEILKGLNAFTQLGTDHRWDDEEDDDDDVLDFGDGMIYPAHEHPSSMEPEPEQAFDEPVAQSERFVEDFDRSWPRRPPRPIPQPVLVEEAAPKRIVDGDRVLFNASSNRLESTPQRRPPPPPQALPTKLLSRDLAAPSQALERPPPVSAAIPDQPQAEVNGPAPARGPGSMLPPSLRQAWGSRDHDQRPPPSQTRELPLPSQRPDHSPRAPLSTLPPRRSFSQAKDNALPPPPPTEQHLPATSPTSSTQPVSPGDFQSQEMHAAAEKARLRRLAEEQEREAAAERARMKAKELEDRLAAKASSSKPAPEASKPSQPTVSAPPPGLASRPQIVIAQRPKPPTTLVPAQSATPITAQPTPSPSKPASGLAGLPPRPGAEPSTGESWRGKNVQPKTLLSPVATTAGRAARPTAESFFEPSPAVEAAAVDTVVNLPSSPEKQVGKKDGGFDDMLARIQAAMAQTRLAPPSPTPGPEPSRSPGRSPSIAMATAEEIKILSHSTPLPTQEYFDVTQIPIPKSPPPAWRTFAVKLPRSSQPRLPPPRWRIEAFETSLRHIPKGWIMSFNPPVDQLNPLTLSRAELLLPAQVPRRFSRHFDSGPIVSISPRRLETMSKPKKKPIFEAARPAEVIQPVTSTSTLLPPTVDQAPSTSSLTDPRWAAGPSVDALVNDLLPPSKTFVASIPNAPLTKDAAFTPEDSRATASVAKLAAQRPGVRFMVSSEMEGESLLNEINKMSLESVGEGTEDKTDSPKSRSSARASGGETPKTPPSLSASSSREPHSSPTNEASTPWSKTSGRSVSQHDQIRAFWDPSRPVETAPTRPTEVAVVNPQSLDPSVPTYASLNGPSPSDSGAPRTVNTNLKMGAVSSQPFSPASDPSSSFSMRQTSSGGAGFALSPEQQNMIGLYARSPANNQSTVANGYGTQQGVWSPSVFNTGYGYIKPVGSGMSAIDQKAALAFNSAQSPQMQHAKPTPNGSMYGALGNNDFRFPNQQSYSTSPYQAQSQAAAQAFQVQQAQQAASPQHQFMQSPYTNPRGTIAVASPPQQAAYNPYGSVQYGAAASQLGAGVRGRTGNASVDGSAEFGYQAGGGQFGHLTTSASGYSPAFAAGGPNSRSVSGVHGAIGQQGRAGAGVGMGSAQRRVW